MSKKIIYFDMDNVLVNFQSGLDQLPEEVLLQYEGQLDNIPSVFSLMKPLNGAIEAFTTLASEYDNYINIFCNVHYSYLLRLFEEPIAVIFNQAP